MGGNSRCVTLVIDPQAPLAHRIHFTNSKPVVDGKMYLHKVSDLPAYIFLHITERARELVGGVWKSHAFSLVFRRREGEAAFILAEYKNEGFIDFPEMRSYPTIIGLLDGQIVSYAFSNIFCSTALEIRENNSQLEGHRRRCIAAYSKKRRMQL